MQKILARIGPGMMLAAVAVGVSHLVYSTQAGANYGLSLFWVILVISLLKYPAFRLAVDYTNATGTSLVTAYAKISKIALAWLVVGFFVDMFIATSAVALVTAGLFISVFDLSYSNIQIAIALMVISAIFLLNGQYKKSERIVKILVLAFSLLTIVAMIFSLPLLGSDDRAIFAELTPSRSLSIFVIAVAGWMPMPTNGALLFSKWVCEKRAIEGDKFDSATALSDFRIGYTLTVVLAMCFIVMGTGVLFDTGRIAPSRPPEFAAELFTIFTTTIGQWSYPVIAAAGIAVMWSTLIALMDVMPRLTDRLAGIITGRPREAPSRYTQFSIVQVIGVSVILLFFMKSFTAFLYFATSVGLIAAPAIGYYNYIAVTSDEVSSTYIPKRGIILWNWLGVIVMTAFAIAFLYTRIFEL